MQRVFIDLYALLNASERRHLVVLIFGFVVLSLFDLVSISLVGPFLAAFTTPDPRLYF